jgi:hypothetical protein
VGSSRGTHASTGEDQTRRRVVAFGMIWPSMTEATSRTAGP